MPAEVVSLVRQAINAGWRPETPGPQFRWKMAASIKHSDERSNDLPSDE